MKFTDHFIQRPVMATVISLLIFCVGLRAIFELPVRQFPLLENTAITITTSYPGADPELMQGFITTPIEKAIASAEGVDYITSTSADSVSNIVAHIRLNFNPNTALVDIMSKVAQTRNQLPRESNEPVIVKGTGRSFALMYIGFYSKQMSSQQITDYLTRVVQPEIETIKGVGSAKILGKHTFAMRIWLNPVKMAALHVTAQQVMQALQNNNYQSAAGSTRGDYVTVTIKAKTDLVSTKQFSNLVVAEKNGVLVRLKDIAKVVLGSQTYNNSVVFNGQGAVFMGVAATPSANPLSMIRRVRQALPGIINNFPNTLKGKIVYDATDFIRASIKEVIVTLIEATLIVILVIFLFLGAFRTVLIPVITIPLSLVGVCAVMLAMGYSINLLTLLAMVLAIGLVVDDAIIVVENVYRHIEEGMNVKEAAIAGARQIVTPVISMTITLAAVYAPIGLLTGITGALFREFAFTLAFAVIISGVIALTLSPMMCSKFFNKELIHSPLVKRVDAFVSNIRDRYAKRLMRVLHRPASALTFAFVVFISCIFLPLTIPKTLAPQENTMALFSVVQAPQYANLRYLEKYTKQIAHIFETFPDMQDYFIVNGMDGMNSGFAGMILKPWGEQKSGSIKLKPILQRKLSSVPGVQAVTFLPAPLPTQGGGLPIEFVVTATNSYQVLSRVMEKLLNKVRKSGLMIYSDVNLKFDKPQLVISINRSKAAQLGITMQAIGNTLAGLYGENYINRFQIDGQSYEVIPQVPRRYRMSAKNFNQVYLHTASGKSVPLSTVISVKSIVEPNALTQFQQLNSATLQGVMMPGKSMGQVIDFLEKTAKTLLPAGMSYSFKGQSRQYVKAGNSMALTFAFALLVIFLVLSAQFESFTDSVVILVSVPMAICGALIPLSLGLGSLNIYSEVGLVTLIGLISKHGILMVDFANKMMREKNYTRLEAIHHSATIRFRPILMTTASMVLGVVPLLIASGAGGASRFSIGVVIFFGMLIGTCFTLFMVPTMYLVSKHWLLWIIAVILITAITVTLLGLVGGVSVGILALLAPIVVHYFQRKKQNSVVT